MVVVAVSISALVAVAATVLFLVTGGLGYLVLVGAALVAAICFFLLGSDSPRFGRVSVHRWWTGRRGGSAHRAG